MNTLFALFKVPWLFEENIALKPVVKLAGRWNLLKWMHLYSLAVIARELGKNLALQFELIK